MYFAASKVFWFIAKPSTVLLLSLTVGLVLRLSKFRKLSTCLVLMGLTGFWLAAALPAGPTMMRVLETRFPTQSDLPERIGGIIVLGGALSPELSQATGRLNLNGNVERYLYFKILSDKYPAALLIFTGGSGNPLRPDAREGDYVAEIAAAMGLDPHRILIERDSRNTFENAEFSKKLAGPAADQPWILITSARHMPRAVGVFRHHGWKVIAYPVDHTLDPVGTAGGVGFNFLGGLAQVDSAVREYIGLAAAYVLGQSDRLFPSPE
ncbi:MAG: YdcF family protein [Rhodospirillaceae bacterium]